MYPSPALCRDNMRDAHVPRSSMPFGAGLHICIYIGVMLGCWKIKKETTMI